MRSRHFYEERVRRLVAECVLEDRDRDTARRRLQVLVDEDNITPYGLRMFAGLELEREAFGPAATLLAKAIERRARQDDDNDDEVDRVLLGHAQFGAGEHDDALSIFDALIEGSEHETGTLLAECHQARGDLLSKREQFDLARAAYEASLAACDDDDGKFDKPFLHYDLACLELDRGDAKAALAELEPHMPLDEYDQTRGEARYLLANLLQRAGRGTEAIAALEKALDETRDPAALRARLLADDAFESLRDHEGYATVASERLADASWLDRYRPLAALRDDPKLHKLGVRFVDEDEAKDGGDALRAHYGDSLHLGTLWTDQIWAACQKVAEGLCLIAEGPGVPGQRHVGGPESTVSLYADPENPDKVWLAPHAEFPAALFTDLPSDPQTVARAIEQLFLDPPSSRAELPKVARAFMGYLKRTGVPSPYSGELEEAGPHELDRHFNFSPALDPLVWGGAYPEDPWPDAMPPVNQVRMVMCSRERRAQVRGSVAKLTRRAQFSRAHVGYEIHQVEGEPMYVWEIRYRPNPFPTTIERFNEMCDTNYPTDLPADVVAGIHGFDWLTAAKAEARLSEVEADAVPAYLEVIAAIRHNDLGVTQLLREHAARPDVTVDGRGRIANLCLEYNWRALLEEIALVETDEDLRGQMLRVLQGPFPETRFTEMGEPEGTYGSGDDDDDDDYDHDDPMDDYDDDDDQGDEGDDDA